MVPCILVDREGLGNEWLLNVCGVVTVMAKKLVVKRETHPTMSSFRSESPDGWIL